MAFSNQLGGILSPLNNKSDNYAFGSGGYIGLDDSRFNAYAQEVYDYQKEIWAREDSAYQRMVEDMKKAGLNPWTGVSSGGSPTSSNNPASEALKSLLSMLEYNLKAVKGDNQYKKDVWSIGLDFMKTIVPVISMLG